MYSTGKPGERVEKLMSFTREEFEHGLERLTGTPVLQTPEGAYDLSAAADGKTVSCTFEPEPDAVLGGLMRLSRARVVLDMSALPEPDRTAFLDHFEKTFQRGGG